MRLHISSNLFFVFVWYSLKALSVNHTHKQVASASAYFKFIVYILLDLKLNFLK